MWGILKQLYSFKFGVGFVNERKEEYGHSDWDVLVFGDLKKYIPLQTRIINSSGKWKGQNYHCYCPVHKKSKGDYQGYVID